MDWRNEWSGMRAEENGWSHKIWWTTFFTRLDHGRSSSALEAGGILRDKGPLNSAMMKMVDWQTYVPFASGSVLIKNDLEEELEISVLREESSKT